jgi:hypothetical protein
LLGISAVRLSEIFRIKEYIAEIRKALKLGYSFDDLAEIFTERCGVAVSARQIKCHFTREVNRGKKSKSVKKAERNTTTENSVSSEDSSRKDAAQNTQRSVTATGFLADSETKAPSKDTEKGTGFVSENSTVRDTKVEVLSPAMKL